MVGEDQYGRSTYAEAITADQINYAFWPERGRGMNGVANVWPALGRCEIGLTGGGFSSSEEGADAAIRQSTLPPLTGSPSSASTTYVGSGSVYGVRPYLIPFGAATQELGIAASGDRPILNLDAGGNIQGGHTIGGGPAKDTFGSSANNRGKLNAGYSGSPITPGSGSGAGHVGGSLPPEIRPPTDLTGIDAKKRTALVRPIRTGAYQPDTRFSEERLDLPLGWPGLPPGTMGQVIGATIESRQDAVYAHGDPRLVCVNAGRDPEHSSVVFDTTPSDGDYDLRLGGAPLHSAWRVLHPITSESLSCGHGPVLAWQLARGERDSRPGYGVVVDVGAVGGRGNVVAEVARPPVVTGVSVLALGTAPQHQGGGPDVNGAWYAESAAGNHWQVQSESFRSLLEHQQADWLRAIRGGGAGATLTMETPGRPKRPTLTVGLASARAGGPLEVGDSHADKHKCGESGGLKTNALHISTAANFWMNPDFDGPLFFEPFPYPRVLAGPEKRQVHLVFDRKAKHAFQGRMLPGAWRWYADCDTVPSEGEPPPTTPPTTGPPPTTPPEWPPRRRPPVTTPPTTEKPPPVVTPPSDDPTQPPDNRGGRERVGGAILTYADSPGRGYGILDNVPAHPVSSAGAGAGFYVAGETVEGVKPPGIAATIPRAGDFAAPGPVLPRVLRSREVHEPVHDEYVAHPTPFAPGVLLFQPSDMRPNVEDVRSSIFRHPTKARMALEEHPVVLRAEPWGAQRGDSWTYTQRPLSGRFRSGTGSGGLLFMPSEMDLADLRASASFPGTFAHSTGYVATYGEWVWWGAGTPDLATGGLKSGARWGLSGGAFVLQGLNSSGTAVTALSVSTAGVPSIRESSGPDLLAVGAIGANQVVMRSAGTLVGRTPASGWTAATGTATRSGFDTATVTLPELAQHVKAIIDDHLSMFDFTP